MRVDATKQAAFSQSDAFAHEPTSGTPARRDSESRALVVTAPAAIHATAAIHRQAAFLAHLIATKDHAPQTRERRRADPGEALAAYRTADALTRS